MSANEQYQRQLDEQATSLPSTGVTATLGCLWLTLGPAVLAVLLAVWGWGT